MTRDVQAVADRSKKTWVEALALGLWTGSEQMELRGVRRCCLADTG
jgi:hypothetical protein